MSIHAPMRGGIRGSIRAPIHTSGGRRLLLDTLAVSPYAAFSLRKLRTAYSGSAIRVRRSSDNAEQDIGFVGNVLDTASLLTFTGANNGFVVTFYGQNAGTQINATQATAAAQPQIVASGVVLLIGARPAMRFDGTNDVLQSAAIPALAAGPLTMNGVASQVGRVTNYEIWWALGETDTGGQNIDVGGGQPNSTVFYVGGAAVPGGGAGISTGTRYIATTDHSGTAASSWLNTVAHTDNKVFNYTGATGRVTLGANRTGITGFSNTLLSEYMAFGGASLSAGNRAVLEANQGAFYP